MHKHDRPLVLTNAVEGPWLGVQNTGPASGETVILIGVPDRDHWTLIDADQPVRTGLRAQSKATPLWDFGVGATLYAHSGLISFRALLPSRAPALDWRGVRILGANSTRPWTGRADGSLRGIQRVKIHSTMVDALREAVRLNDQQLRHRVAAAPTARVMGAANG